MLFFVFSNTKDPNDELNAALSKGHLEDEKEHHTETLMSMIKEGWIYA